MEFVKLEKISKSFGRQQALGGIDLALREGEMSAVMGKSGSGKSTLLHILAGLMEPDSGIYYFQGEAIPFGKRRTMELFRERFIGVVLQNYALLSDRNIFENIALPLRYRRCKPTDIQREVTAIAGRMGIAPVLEKYPEELSGGECQRAAIARALIKKPRLLVADEPTGALDSQTGTAIMELLEQLRAEGNTIVIATHDREVARRCTKVFRLHDGVIQPSSRR